MRKRHQTKGNEVQLSIVICNFNTKDLLQTTLSSIYSHVMNISFEVIVVDDASTDDSVKMIKQNFQNVILLQNSMNLGYSKSCNRGTKIAKGAYILHLNSDVEFEKDVDFGEVLNYLERNNDIGILGCKIITLDCSLDLTCKRSFPTLGNALFQSTGLTKLFPKNKIIGNYYLTYLDENKIHEVDCLAAFMLIRREVFETVGYIDERFFIYGEDIDFCYRTKQYGWKIVYYPLFTIKHHHNASLEKLGLKNIFLFHKAMVIYYSKHSDHNNLVKSSVYLAIFFRFIFVTIMNRVSYLLSKRY